MSEVAFENIPGSGLVAPLTALELTSGGQFQSETRFNIIAHVNSGAPLAVNTPTVIHSQLEADQLCGAGSMASQMWRISRANAPIQEIWMVAAADTGTARVVTLRIDTASEGLGVYEIGGEPVSVEIGAGDAVGDVAAALAANINGYRNALTGAQLEWTATATTDTVTATARHKGAIFNDYDFYVPALSGDNAFTGNVTFDETTPGSGNPDLSGALASLGDDPADFIVSAFADATNLGRYQTLLSDVSGRWAWSRQSYGHAFTVFTGTTSEITTFGLGRNDRHTSPIMRKSNCGDYHPAWMWVAGIVARVAPWLSDGTTGRISVNQSNLAVQGLRAPRDKSAVPDYAGRNAFLKSGISTWSVQADGTVAIDKLVTGYRTNPAGQPDETFRDVQALFQASYVFRSWRAMFSYEFANKAAADENPGDNANLVTPNDVKAALVHSHIQMVSQGILENTDRFASEIKVARNTDYPNRFDIFAPIDRTNPLDVLATNARLYSQYRDAA